MDRTTGAQELGQRIRSPRFLKATTQFRWARRRSAREGSAVTVLAYGAMVHVAEAGIAESGRGRGAIDLRSIVPLDIDTIVAIGPRKTGRCVIFHEATRFSGFGAELSALVESVASTISKRRSSGSAGGHALPPRLRMGLFSRARPARRRAGPRVMEPA